jgi:hypothetical protein
MAGSKSKRKRRPLKFRRILYFFIPVKEGFPNQDIIVLILMGLKPKNKDNGVV